MNKNSMATIAVPTGSVFPPSGVFGVSIPMSGTINMQQAIPIAPTISKNFLPNLSTVHVAFNVKTIPMVAFNALMRLILSSEVQTFL